MGAPSWRQRRWPQPVNEAQDFSEQRSWDGDLSLLKILSAAEFLTFCRIGIKSGGNVNFTLDRESQPHQMTLLDDLVFNILWLFQVMML